MGAPKHTSDKAFFDVSCSDLALPLTACTSYPPRGYGAPRSNCWWLQMGPKPPGPSPGEHSAKLEKLMCSLVTSFQQAPAFRNTCCSHLTVPKTARGPLQQLSDLTSPPAPGGLGAFVVIRGGFSGPWTQLRHHQEQRGWCRAFQGHEASSSTPALKWPSRRGQCRPAMSGCT